MYIFDFRDDHRGSRHGKGTSAFKRFLLVPGTEAGLLMIRSWADLGRN